MMKEQDRGRQAGGKDAEILIMAHNTEQTGAEGAGNHEVAARQGKKLAIISASLNVFFAAGKLILYFLTGSFAILAETMHSLADVTGSLLIIGGLYLSEKKSERFPWGLYKVENIAAILSAAMIFVAAYEIAKVIYHPLPRLMRNLDLALVVIFLFAIPIIIFARYEGTRAKAINFPSLTADAEHWKTDIAPLLIVAAGIAGSRLSYPVMDRIAASLILFVVLRAGYGIFRDSMKSLLDASIDGTTLMKIKDVVTEFSQVKEIASLNARNSGRFIFISMDVRFSSRSLKDAHEVADHIEGKIRKRVPFVEKVSIHFEPEKKEYQRFAVPLEDKVGTISEHFGKAPLIALWSKKLSDKTVSAPEILENAFSELEKGKGLKLAKFLADGKIDVLFTKEDFRGEGPQQVFWGADIEVRKTELKTLKELMLLEK
jgi:cation diffusion facilitator family transporter